VSLGNKRYSLWLSAIALVVVGAALYFWGPGSVPLVSLTKNNLSLFKQTFDGNPKEARVVLLLSPT
jgi:hypothetical protein